MTEERTTFSYRRLGHNKVGIPVFGRLTQTITAECFNGVNAETGLPKWRPCSTVISAGASLRSTRR
jgi:hypothetical protein